MKTLVPFLNNKWYSTDENLMHNSTVFLFHATPVHHFIFLCQYKVVLCTWRNILENQKVLVWLSVWRKFRVYISKIWYLATFVDILAQPKLSDFEVKKWDQVFFFMLDGRLGLRTMKFAESWYNESNEVNFSRRFSADFTLKPFEISWNRRTHYDIVEISKVLYCVRPFHEFSPQNIRHFLKQFSGFGCSSVGWQSWIQYQYRKYTYLNVSSDRDFLLGSLPLLLKGRCGLLMRQLPYPFVLKYSVIRLTGGQFDWIYSSNRYIY